MVPTSTLSFPLDSPPFRTVMLTDAYFDLQSQTLMLTLMGTKAWRVCCENVPNESARVLGWIGTTIQPRGMAFVPLSFFFVLNSTWFQYWRYVNRNSLVVCPFGAVCCLVMTDFFVSRPEQPHAHTIYVTNLPFFAFLFPHRRAMADKIGSRRRRLQQNL